MNPFEEFLRTLFLQKANNQTVDQQLTDPIDINNAYVRVAKSPYFRDTLRVNAPIYRGDLGSSTFAQYEPHANRSGEISVNVYKPIPYRAMLDTEYPADFNSARNVLTHEGAHAIADWPGGLQNNFPSWSAVKRPQFYAEIPREKSMSLSDILKGQFNVPSVIDNHPINDTEINMQTKEITERRPSALAQIFLGKKTRTMSPSEVAAFEALSPYYSFAGRSRWDSGRAIGDPSESFAQAFTNAADFLSRTSSDTTGYRQLLGRYEGNTPGMGGIVADLLERNPIYSNHPLHGLIRSSLPKEKKKK